MRQRPLKPLRQQINDLLHLHTGERRGFLLMMALLILLSGWVVLEQWIFAPARTDLEPIRARMEAWVAERRAAEARDRTEHEPFPFDPNTIERKEWIDLGFTDRQVDGIERYMSKGGRFRVKRDLAKLYSIRPGQYERLEPFILLPDSVPRRTYRQKERYPRGDGTKMEQWPSRTADHRDLSPTRRVEVNSADSAELVALSGIGPSFAKGILKYRESLGGYVSLDQLAEVYVLQDKPDAVQRLKDLLVVDTLAIRKIPVNTCTVEELAAHPYVRWKLAKPLVAFRQQHGPFQRVEDIRGCVLVNEEVFRKLAPYLSVE